MDASRDRFPLSTSREPNPLRPYSIPASIGSGNINISSSPSHSQTPHVARPATVSSNFSSQARDLLPELDLDLTSTTGEAWQHTRKLFDALAWRYMSVLLAQPFDVAKTVLQVSLPVESAAAVRSTGGRAAPRRTATGLRRDSRPHGEYSDEDGTDEDGSESELSEDIPDYFTSSAPRSRSPRRRRRTPPTGSLSPSPTPTPKNRRSHDIDSDYKLRLKKLDSISQAISAVYSTSGAVGLWRATNATFLYSILLRTTDSFVRSLLLTIIGLPDIVSPEPGGLGPSLGVYGAAGFSGLDLSESPNPLGSLVVVGLASCMTGILLAPLDLVRTRLIVTPTHYHPRGLVQNLRQLPSLLIPSTLWLPTALYHSIPQIFSAATPLFLRRQLRMTPELTPSLWSLAAFATALTDLFVRLPLETLMRRAQLHALIRDAPVSQPMPIIIEPAPYAGVWATVYGILYLEGERTTKDAKGMLRTRRGQGVPGLVRGWRVGFWGLVGVWAAGAMGPGEAAGGRGQF